MSAKTETTDRITDFIIWPRFELEGSSVAAMYCDGFHKNFCEKRRNLAECSDIDQSCHGRGTLGWIVNVVLSVIGGLVALSLMSMALETVMTAIHQGKLATSDHPLRYIADVAMPLFTVLGSWIPLQIVNRVALRFAH